MRKYPTSTRVYLPNNQPPKAGDIFRNPDLARTLKRLVEAEKQNASKGRHSALQAARDRFYKGDIAVEMAKFSEANGGLFRYEDFAAYSAKVEEPVSIDYRGYQVYKNPSASQGPAELFARDALQYSAITTASCPTSAKIFSSAPACRKRCAHSSPFHETAGR